MAVSLDKTPQLLLFLAVVTGAGTDDAQVCRLLLTRDEGYDDQVNSMHDQAQVVDGAEVICVVAEHRGAAYAAARKGECSEELFSRWIDQQRIAWGL